MLPRLISTRPLVENSWSMRATTSRAEFTSRAISSCVFLTSALPVRDLVRKKAEERWGSGVVEQLSLDLQRDFPDADGFSVSNLWFMKKWYCFYTRKGANQILYQAGRELVKSKSSRSDSEKLQQPVRELDEAKSSRFDREKLPDLQSKLVQDVLKENYDFGFATVGHEIYDEAAKSTCCFTISACAVSSPAN